MRFMALSLMITLTLAVSGADNKDNRPKLSLKATPPMGTNPVRVVASADLSGGANDYEEFYCPSVEWDWGDDTKSTNAADCDPYEAGKSQITRRFTSDHTYRQAGNFRIQFRLKKKDKTTAASTSVQVRPGIYDGGGLP